MEDYYTTAKNKRIDLDHLPLNRAQTLETSHPSLGIPQIILHSPYSLAIINSASCFSFSNGASQTMDTLIFPLRKVS
jgi:hypothetical protein